MNDIKYENIDANPIGHITTKKQVWDGEKFVPRMLHRIPGSLTYEQLSWLRENFSNNVSAWGYSDSGNFYTMDEQVYAWFQLKWGNK